MKNGHIRVEKLNNGVDTGVQNMYPPVWHIDLRRNKVLRVEHLHKKKGVDLFSEDLEKQFELRVAHLITLIELRGV